MISNVIMVRKLALYHSDSLKFAKVCFVSQDMIYTILMNNPRALERDVRFTAEGGVLCKCQFSPVG